MRKRKTGDHDQFDIDWTTFNNLCLQVVRTVATEVPSHYGDGSLKRLYTECYHANAIGFFAPTGPPDTPLWSKQHKVSEKDQKRALLQWVNARKANKPANPSKVEGFLDFCVRANDGRLTTLIHDGLLQCNAVENLVARSKIDGFRAAVDNYVNAFKALPKGEDKFLAAVYGFESYQEKIVITEAGDDVIHEVSGVLINLAKNQLAYYMVPVFTDSPLAEAELRPKAFFNGQAASSRGQGHTEVTKWDETPGGGRVGVIKVRFPRPLEQYERIELFWSYHSPGSITLSESGDYHQAGVNVPIFRHSIVLEVPSGWRFRNIDITSGTFRLDPPNILKWDMLFPRQGGHRLNFSLIRQ